MTIIIVKSRKPIPTNTPIILQSHANIGNNDTIPAPIKTTPINPPKCYSWSWIRLNNRLEWL